MTSQHTPTSLTARITPHLPLAEKILLTSLLIGIVLTIMQIDSAVASVSLLGLAATFFLLAYRPIDVPRQENELLGLSELLAFMIVPKVLWISSAISALGIAFYMFNFGNPGYKNMLMIGGSTIAVAALILAVLLVSGVKHIRMVTPILLRALPICLIDFYILFK